jgi:hypothetical protein
MTKLPVYDNHGLTTRVQIPAYTDMWMRGDRFGNVIKVAKAKAGVRARLLTEDPRRYSGDIEIAHVLLDKSNKVVKVVLADCEVL